MVLYATGETKKWLVGGSNPQLPPQSSSKILPFYLEIFLVMYSIKEYPEEFTQSKSRQWLKFKKKLKKIYHTRLRRGKLEKLKANGREIAW